MSLTSSRPLRYIAMLATLCNSLPARADSDYIVSTQKIIPALMPMDEPTGQTRDIAAYLKSYASRLNNDPSTGQATYFVNFLQRGSREVLTSACEPDQVSGLYSCRNVVRYNVP